MRRGANMQRYATGTEPEISGLIIPGSARNSDLSTSIAFVKGKIKIYIQNSQKLGHIYLW